MVRRRSTVRFRKGALQVIYLFRYRYRSKFIVFVDRVMGDAQTLRVLTPRAT
jgi:hypothetical protein